MTRKVPLTLEKFALVDDVDFERVNQWVWYALKGKNGWVAVRTMGKRPFRKTVYMHRFIMEVTDPKIDVDHKDHDGLNNQRHNLRVASRLNNTRNRRVHKDSLSGYKGVTKHENGKYYARIWNQGEDFSLGGYKTPEEAARAYDQAAKVLHGEFASLNFPDE